MALAGCARAAPELPPTFASAPAPQMESEARLQRCAVLKTEIADLRDQVKIVEEVIAGSRHEEQVGAYFAAVLFPPAALLIDQQTARKKALDERQKNIDLKLAERHALQCP
jgi:hypothetical protein